MLEPLLTAFIAFAGLQTADSSTELGPRVGDRLPAFEAQDQNGKTQTLETLRGANGLLLLFYRSADW